MRINDMKNIISWKWPLAALLMVFSMMAHAQTPARKFNVTGAARGIFFGDRLDQNVAIEDTITIPRLNSGHVMADLGLNIRPNKNMEIQGMVRVRNDYGGFWGSGVSFDIRQMYIKGVIGGVVRYQLGDINYRMTKYTLWNSDQELLQSTPTIFRQQYDVLNYDHFYNDDNSWRQQGGATEFGLVFKKYIQELQFRAVATRVRASDNSSTNDRIFGGANIQLLQSKYFHAGFNYVSLFDVEGTSRNSSIFRNPVVTGTAKAMWSNEKWSAYAQAELARSKAYYVGNDEAPYKQANASDLELSVSNKEWGVSLGATMKRIEGDFNSPGAQTKRINYGQLPTAYGRITNEQTVRQLTIMDLMRESSLYNLQLQPYLMNFSPKYDNITPYGDATPNRQGTIVRAEWKDKKNNWTVKAEQYMLGETQGEGTIEAREFSRTQVGVEFKKDKISEKWGRMVRLQANFRRDQTTRPGSEFYRGVELNTDVASLGLELEIMEKLDLLVGWQQVNYNGFDFVSVKDEYASIFNFQEYSVNGKEIMQAAGLRYRFSEKSFLSAQWNTFNTQDATLASTSYKVDQFMLLYQMNF
jgi:hypothetical protein